ncbi:MAG: hypothetical protein ABJO27_24350 [Pseudoruegeria sp.]
MVMSTLGVALLVNATHLILASNRTDIRGWDVIWFSLGDFGWWLASLALIVTNLWITSAWGIFAATLVACIVAGLGVAQLWIFGRTLHGNNRKDHFKACISSWMALPTWVKIWLVLLNGVFLVAFAFLPGRIAEVTLISYIATGPLLVGQIGYDGGLRRILALAHIVPWTPLLAWLLLISEFTPYTLVLIPIVAISLVFDFNDVRLFLMGDRSVIGKPLQRH